MSKHTSPNQSTTKSKAMMESPFALTPYLCDDDWKTLGYLDSSSTRLSPGKTYTTLFTKDSFWGTEDDWKLIQPAVWLASELFQTPLSMRFIVGLIYNSKMLPSEIDFRGKPSYQFDFAKGTEDEIASLYQGIIEDVEEYHTWGPYELNRLPGYEGWHGLCNYPLPEEGCDILPGADPRGIGRPGNRTRFYFNQTIIEQMRETSTESPEMQALQFYLAITLCHEATHAIQIASDWISYLRASMFFKFSYEYQSPDPFFEPCFAEFYTPDFTENEPYFKDSWVAELGYAWEQLVLGGRIDQCSGHPNPTKSPFLTIGAWPDVGVFSAHEGLPCREMTLLSMENRCPTKFPVSMYYISKVFQVQFWDEFWAGGWVGHARPRQEAGMIKVPRTVGYKLRAPYAIKVFREIDETANDLASASPSNSLDILAAARLLKVLYCILTDRKNVEINVTRVVYREPGPRMISNTAFEDRSGPDPTKQCGKIRVAKKPTDSEREFFASIYPGMPDEEFLEAIMVLMIEDDSEDGSEGEWEECPEDVSENELEDEA